MRVRDAIAALEPQKVLVIRGKVRINRVIRPGISNSTALEFKKDFTQEALADYAKQSRSVQGGLRDLGLIRHS